jgi:hypothetical protein
MTLKKGYFRVRVYLFNFKINRIIQKMFCEIKQMRKKPFIP